jgi:hypothetical protein
VRQDRGSHCPENLPSNCLDTPFRRDQAGAARRDARGPREPPRALRRDGANNQQNRASLTQAAFFRRGGWPAARRDRIHWLSAPYPLFLAIPILEFLSRRLYAGGQRISGLQEKTTYVKVKNEARGARSLSIEEAEIHLIDGLGRPGGVGRQTAKGAGRRER